MLEQLGSQASLFKRVFPFVQSYLQCVRLCLLCFFFGLLDGCTNSILHAHGSYCFCLSGHTQSFNFAATLVFWSFLLLHQHHRTWSGTLLVFVMVFIRLHWHNAIWVDYGLARTLGGLTLSLAPKWRRGSTRQLVGNQEPDAFSRRPHRRGGSPRILVSFLARYGPG